jgi:hypothetical protein
MQKTDDMLFLHERKKESFFLRLRALNEPIKVYHYVCIHNKVTTRVWNVYGEKKKEHQRKAVFSDIEKQKEKRNMYSL